jgi:hypothetical protein
MPHLLVVTATRISFPGPAEGALSLICDIQTNIEQGQLAGVLETSGPNDSAELTLTFRCTGLPP